MGLAVRVDYRRSVAEPQWEPRSVSAAVTSRPMVKQLARPTMCQAYVLAGDLIHRTSELAGVFERSFFQKVQ